jgi:hypothetical protein
MNISKERWLQLKQELPTLIFFCVFQLWFSLTYPPVEHEGLLLKYVCASALTILVACSYAYAFLFPEAFIRFINLEFFDDYPNPGLVKNSFKMSMFVIMHILYGYVWYTNIYRRAQSWYILCYGVFVIMLVLTCEAFRRIEENKKLDC